MTQGDLSIPQFSVGAVANAAGVPVETLRTWLKRGDVVLAGVDQSPAGAGLGRLLSGFTAVAVGIMAALSKNGVPLAAASVAANEFVHAGDERRNPCHLFPDSMTFLVLRPHGAEVINLGEAETFADVFCRHQRVQDALPLATFLRLDELVDRVRCNLGLGRDPLTPVNGKPTGYAAPRVRKLTLPKRRAKVPA